MSPSRTSEKTVRRLSHYSMCLRRAMKDGRQVITSKYLSHRCGISSAAVRKDLATFGEFGKQGSGYRVEDLLENIEHILGTVDPPPVVIVGMGNIGRALLESGLEGTGGYRYAAAFDRDPSVIGKTCAGIKIKSVEELKATIGELGSVLAIMAVPPGEGQNALNRLVAAGCRSILSFTLEPLEVPEQVCLRYLEVSTELDLLTHYMKSDSTETG
ncbi:MAG: redox-sensing transcriptional repressor Rex [Candidatus Aegiribacteria sp.]|nr:redox-sensing transcriptional repressor Rex [Candidatus Aegiribacteria sp.]